MKADLLAVRHCDAQGSQIVSGQDPPQEKLMDPRIHDALEQDSTPASLAPEAAAELARVRRLLDAATASVRDVPVPDLTARVMAALPAGAPRRTLAGQLRRAADWLARPRSVELVFRPAYVLAGGLATLLLFVVPVPPAARPGAPALPPTFAEAPAPVLVQFRLTAPGAQRVALAGTFTDWRPRVELRETAPGEWAALVPLAPGVHDYAFVVDNERWVADPHAPRVDDDFGGSNSRLSLPPVTLQS
jgi:hypothetical protein